MKPKEFLKHTLTDIKVKLEGEFKRNFEDKGFFGKKWKTGHFQGKRGIMWNTGNLVRSIKGELTPNGIKFSSSMPYAEIHNKGGEIVVTAKMKRYFWAMYYKSAGAISTTKSGKARKSKRNVRLSQEAQKWKNLALMKVGQKMKIEQRQFIGHHPKVDGFIREIIDHNVKKLNKELKKQVKQKSK